jgi:hypothetical protein
VSDTQTMFLTREEVEILTGRKRSAMQAEQLKRLRIPFYTNAVGCPVVTRVAVEGRPQPKKAESWSPSL